MSTRLWALVTAAATMLLLASLASTAGATFPEALDNVAGNTFSGTSGEGILEDPASKLAVRCAKGTATGEITGPKTGKGIGTAEGCTITGLSINSLGDKSGTILVPATGTLCYISKTKKEVGILYALPVGGIHAETPAIGELFVVSGSMVSKVAPVNTLTTKGTITDAKPNVSCEGEKDGLLLEKEHNGKALVAELTRMAEVTFAKDGQIDA
jgi:hypothetical protein